MAAVGGGVAVAALGILRGTPGGRHVREPGCAFQGPCRERRGGTTNFQGPRWERRVGPLIWGPCLEPGVGTTKSKKSEKNTPPRLHYLFLFQGIKGKSRILTPWISTKFFPDSKTAPGGLSGHLVVPKFSGPPNPIFPKISGPHKN